MEKKRIAWIDIYKCVVIILVVAGHSTGLFNKYIYQFHMAAFFFISGYVANLEKKSLGDILVNKFFTLFLPVFTFLSGGLAFLKVISLSRFDGYLFPGDFPGIWESVEMFFRNGDINVQFLGACWFITVLLGIFILQKIIVVLCGNQYHIPYILITVFVYALGYYLISEDTFSRWGMFSVDLICVGQMFFALGCVTAQIKMPALEKTPKTVLRLIVLACNLMIFWYFGNIEVNVVDYPSRVFNTMGTDFLTAANGILFIYIISSFLERIPEKIQKILIYTGQNTMGILIFHFLCFKFCFGIFYKLGIMQLEEISAVVPPTAVGNRYWPVLTVFALAGSLGLWEICRRIPLIRFFTGFEKTKYREIYENIKKSAPGKTINNAVRKVNDVMKNAYCFMKTCFRENPYVMISVIVLIFAAVLPMYKQGIICNDELQSRYWSYQGFKTFYKHYFEEHVLKGRALSTPIVSFTMYLGFLGQSNWTFKLMQIISILIVAAIFAVLVYKLFRNKYFAYFCSISIILFLPVTFEHTVPNAFVTLYNVPFALLLWSMILFLDYLEQEDRRKLMLSMVLLLVAEMSYEAFVTFVPVYLMFVVYRYGYKNLFRKWKLSAWPIGNAVVFLALYLLSGKIFASNYEGNTIAGIHIKESLVIIKELFAASFPGYWLTTEKYQYLYEILSKDSLEYIVRIVVMAAAFIICIAFILKKSRRDSEKGFGQKSGIIICGLITVVLPTLPISVAEMYQGNVGPDGFMALPVTFFGYFAAVFVCCYIIWQICSYAESKMVRQIAVTAMLIIFVQIQMMNVIYAEEQNRMFDRLVSIEEMIKSDILAKFEGKTIYSEDLFEEQNSLAIHDSYWKQYASASGRNLVFKNKEGTEEQNRIYMNDSDKTFQIWIGNVVCVMSKEKLSGHLLVHYYGEEYLAADCENIIFENDWYMDYFAVEDNSLSECTKDFYMEQLVGNDLSSYVPGVGVYGDGWLSQKSSFKIRTGQAGTISIELYNPQEECTGQTIRIYADGELKEECAAVGGLQQITVTAEPDKVVECTVETDFVQPSTNGDTRELSVILNGLEGR